MLQEQTGKYLMMAGLLLFLVGVLWYFGGHKLQWIGRLPGDIRYESGNTRVYIPITTMLLFSIGLMLVQYIWRKLGN